MTRIAAMVAAVALALSGWTLAADTSPPVARLAASPLERQVSEIEFVQGLSRPRDAIPAYDRLEEATAPFSVERLQVLTAKALTMNLLNGDGAENVARSLDGWKSAENGPGAAAAAALVRGHRLGLRGKNADADAHFTEAMLRLPKASRPYTRARFLVEHVAVLRRAGRLDQALAAALEARKIADDIGLPRLQADVRQVLMRVYVEAAEKKRAIETMDELRQLTATSPNPRLSAALHGYEMWERMVAGDFEGERRQARLAIDQLRSAGDTTDKEGMFLSTIADSYARSGRFDLALPVAEQAIAKLREAETRPFEYLVLARLALAHLGLKHVDEGKRRFEEAVAIAERDTSPTVVSQLLENLYGQLVQTGDAQGAVSAHTRWRKLEAGRALEVQRVMAGTHARFESERRARELAWLKADSELKDAQLRQHDLRLQLGGLLGVVLVLSSAALLVLQRRVRRVNQALQSSNRQLQSMSESDALTGLANRRHFQSAVAGFLHDGGLAGTLYLLDMDRFKQVNDAHGHAAGDAALVQTAHRLRGAVGASDLVVRWGGEEFVVLVPPLDAAAAQATAQRLLSAVGGTPVQHAGESVVVTVSIGFASFPLPPDGAPMSWERAIDLVDTAMYLAKAHGRNRACGVLSLPAGGDRAALSADAHALQAASDDGRATVVSLQGPSG